MLPLQGLPFITSTEIAKQELRTLKKRVQPTKKKVKIKKKIKLLALSWVFGL